VNRAREWCFDNRMLLAYVGFVFVAILVVTFRGETTRDRVETIEREIVTLTPCLQGSDLACQTFLDRLIQAARPEQLRRIRGGDVVTPQEVRKIVREEVREGGGASSGQPGPPPPGRSGPSG
jgi:hypothetical protein